MRSASSATTKDDSFLFESLTVGQISSAIMAGVDEPISYVDYYDSVRNIFANIRFVINLCAGDSAKLKFATKHCLRILASPIVTARIDYLILHNYSMNKDQRIPSILRSYHLLLRDLKNNGGKELHIAEVLLGNVLLLANIRSEEMYHLFHMLSEFAGRPEMLKLVFDTLIEQAETHPHTPLSYLIATSNKENLSYPLTAYLKYLELFAQQNYAIDMILRLFHFKDGNKTKTFYYHKTLRPNFVNRCEELLATLIFKKITAAELLPEEKYLLTHKELVTRYINNLGTTDRQLIVKGIIEDRDTPLSKYFWTARSLTKPSITKGELKKLDLMRVYFPSSAIVEEEKGAAPSRAPVAGSSIFSPRTKPTEVKRDEKHSTEASFVANRFHR